MEKIELIKDLIKKAEKLKLPTGRDVALIIGEAKILAEKFFGVDNKYLKDLNYIASLQLKRPSPKWSIWKSKRYDRNIHYRVQIAQLFTRKIKDIVVYLNLMIKDIKADLVSKEKLEEFQETKSGEVKEFFIEIDFKDYDLAHYISLIELINESGSSNKFYIWIPFQLRCLCENLLYDIFLKSLNPSHKELYYLKSQHRRRDYSKLISCLIY